MYHYVSTEEQLQKVHQWLEGRSLVIFDIETGPRKEFIAAWRKNSKIGLDPRRAEVVTIQVGDKDTQWIVDNRVGLDMKWLKTLLEDEAVAKVGVNLKFDTKMMMHHIGASPKNLVDNFLIEQIIRCGIFPGRHEDPGSSAALTALKYTGMGALAKRYLGLDIDKDKDLRITLWKTPPNKFNKRQLEYMAGDCIYPHQILEKQKPIIIQRGLGAVVNLDHKLIPVVADMELVGIPFDRPYWLELLQENVEAKIKAVNVLNSFLNKKAYIQEDLFGKGKKVNSLNLDSPTEVAKALHRAGFEGFISKGGQPLSTSSSRLKIMKIEGALPAELVDALTDYRKIEKRITAYGTNILKAVNPVSGRIHPDFTQAALVTGRMSCSPGMQTIPKEDTTRRAFDSPNGYTLIVLDASQIEARLSSDMTGDQTAIDVFLRDGDIYTEDGEAFYGVKIDRSTKEGDALRSRAKVSWLGLTYGQGKKSFHNYSRLFLGEEIAKSETDFLYDKFFEIHWKMKEVMDEWSAEVDPFRSHRYVVDDIAESFIPDDRKERLYEMLLDRNWGDEKKAKIQLNTLWNNRSKVRYAETLMGKKRFFRADFMGWWTAGRNLKIQGSAAELQKATMLAFQELHWSKGFDAHIINVVHDEVITLVREDQAEDLIEKQIKLGEEVGQRFLRYIPMKLSGGITKHWKKF